MTKAQIDCMRADIEASNEAKREGKKMDEKLFWQSEGLSECEIGGIIWLKSSQEKLFFEELEQADLTAEYAGIDSMHSDGMPEHKTEEGIFFPWRIK